MRLVIVDDRPPPTASVINGHSCPQTAASPRVSLAFPFPLVHRTARSVKPGAEIALVARPIYRHQPNTGYWSPRADPVVLVRIKALRRPERPRGDEKHD